MFVVLEVIIIFDGFVFEFFFDCLSYWYLFHSESSFKNVQFFGSTILSEPESNPS
jgi:hypothetical protein